MHFVFKVVFDSAQMKNCQEVFYKPSGLDGFAIKFEEPFARWLSQNMNYITLIDNSKNLCPFLLDFLLHLILSWKWQWGCVL